MRTRHHEYYSQTTADDSHSSIYLDCFSHLSRPFGYSDMRRHRAHIPMAELLASALADKLPQKQRDWLREWKVPAGWVIGLFTPDHVILHCHGGADKWWNLTMKLRDETLKAKDAQDTKIAAKVKRLRGETRTGPKRKIPSRPFPERGARS